MTEMLCLRSPLRLSLAVLTVFLAACAGPTPAPSAANSPAPAGAARDSAASNAPAAPAGNGTGTAQAGRAASADLPATTGGARYTVTAEGTEARFRAREQLVGRPLPNEAIGRTSDVTGAIAIGPDGTIVPGDSRIVVDLRQLRSDESRRDNWIHRNTLQTQQFPTAEFVPVEARGLPVPLPTSGDVTFQLAGNLTVHGVTRPTVWDVQAQVAGSEVRGTASTQVKMTDFGMTPPQAGPVLSIEDTVTLELDFRAASGGADVSQTDQPHGT